MSRRAGCDGELVTSVEPDGGAYLSYAEQRMPRTATPQGPARLMFAIDLVGTSQQIAERLYANVVFQQINEVAFALPVSVDHDDYVQILSDIAIVYDAAGRPPPANDRSGFWGVANGWRVSFGSGV